ncbi:hypothetical protein BD779DRAFT_1672807 [Infundibulicybe gibba]|nr:hypothetical protein BD779DRAFT_1672807 [Infundibulicybe gibba]
MGHRVRAPQLNLDTIKDDSTKFFGPHFTPTAIFTDVLKPTIAPIPTVVPVPVPNPIPIPNNPAVPTTIRSVSSSITSTTTSTLIVAPPTTTSSTTSTSTTSTTSTTSSTSTTSQPSQQVVPTTSKIVTVSQTVDASFTSSSVVASPSTTPAASTSTGAIIGGIGGGIIGVALIIFIITFFLRRARKRDSPISFNAGSFRRSAMVMDDPPLREDARGYSPHPPSMVEQRFASPAPTFGTQYGAPGPQYGGDQSAYGYGQRNGPSQFASYEPYQASTMSSPLSPNSSHAMITPSTYGNTSFAPMMSPVSTTANHYEPTPYSNDADSVSGSYLTRNPSTGLNRQLSAASSGVLSHQPMHYEAHPLPEHIPNHHYQAAGYPTNEYVDLDRSSVTPFQAAQYAEISRRLNTDVPAGLSTPAVREYFQANQDRSLMNTEKEIPPPPLPPKEAAMISPFDDPANESAGPEPASARPASPNPPISHRSGSLESVAQVFDFPTPPSPAHTASSHGRVDSMPPMLPEIAIQSRVSYGYDFPSSVRGSNTPSMSSGMPSHSGSPTPGRTLFAEQSRFPVTPSPLATNFTIPSSPIETAAASTPVAIAHPNNEATTVPVGAATPRESPIEKARRDMVQSTIYDPEDAYGGI